MSEDIRGPWAQASALEAEISSHTRDKAAALIEAGAAEARQIRRNAYREARAKVHEAIARLRAERGAAEQRETARLELDRRLRQQRAASQMARRGWPLIEAALRQRWHDETARARWIDAALSLAAIAFRGESWRIEGPRGTAPETVRDIVRRAGESAAAAVEWREADDIEAGLRIFCGGAQLDATPNGLLAKQRAIIAMLLAELGDIEPQAARAQQNGRKTGE